LAALLARAFSLSISRRCHLGMSSSTLYESFHPKSFSVAKLIHAP